MSNNKPKDDEDPPIVIIINRAKAAAKKFASEKPGIAAGILLVVGFVLGRVVG